ncbi:hypothetical protein BCR42DRAFT_410671 [Absidia repens]|uniref:Myb-like domain-containing protein n=1 Tax=Absidia repens TaxID=90262 RepID=A0A1X2IPC6_9FUNG|nr:hypothetical protein BCR42DRAFT_410671 [Absidia repens]
MKPAIPTDDPDTIQWFIIGAYQAGASETEIVSMTNLSRFIIHNTISSFKKTGNPNLRRRKSRKRSTKLDTLHCDSLTDTEDNNSDCSSDAHYVATDYVDMDTGIQEINQRKGRLYRKRTKPFQPKRSSTATDTIDYILHKGQKYEKKNISSIQKPQKQQRQLKQHDYNGTIIPSSSSQSHEHIPPKLQPTLTKHTMDLQLNRAMENTSPHSTIPLCSSDHHRYKQSNSSNETNIWTRKDDKLLLQHVLTRMGRWDELNQLFDGRHSGMDCVERWGVLQHYLFKQLNKNGTNGW